MIISAQTHHDGIEIEIMNAPTRRKAFALSAKSARALDTLIECDARANAETRSRAAASILAGMKRVRSTTEGPSGRELLQQARYGRLGV